MYCTQCGTENQDGSDACEVCGSPLLSSTGDLTCYACGSPTNELDRYCWQCGNALAGPSGQRYEPDPSFVDNELDNVDPTELPAWLREMAQTSGKVHLAAQVHHAQATESGSEQGLPDWLREPVSDIAAGSSPVESRRMEPVSEPSPPAASGQATESLSFINEDDLPEWLRALGDESSEVEPATQVQPEPAPEAPRPLFSSGAPTVSRAWLSRPRAVDPERLELARNDFAPMRQESGSTEGSGSQPEPVHEAGANPSPEPASVASAEASAGTDDGARSRRVRLLILTLALAVLVLLVIVVVQGI